jgi:hypothetical protein
MVQLFLAVVIGLAPATLAAQDPAKISPKDYKVEIENDWVRVLRVKWASHEKTPMQEHLASVVVHLTDSQQRITGADGKVQELRRKAGEVSYTDEGKHVEENISDQPSEAVVVELKREGPKRISWPLPLDAVRLDPQYVSVLFENDRVRVLRTIHEPHIKSPLHEHPHYVVVYLTDMHATMTLADGRQVDDSRKPGDVAWRDALKHVTENNGDRTTMEIQVEIK